MDKEYTNMKWEEVRNQGNGKIDTFKNASQSSCVYVNEKSLQSRAVMAKNMANEYGVMKDGKYQLEIKGIQPLISQVMNLFYLITT